MSAVSMPGVTQPVYLEGGTQPKVDYLSATDLKTDIKSDIKIKTDLRLGGAIIQEPITRIQPKEKIKEKIKERTMIKSQIKPKTRLELLEKVISKTTQINKPRFPEPRPPEPKITIKPILSISPKSTVVKQAEKIMDSFSIFVTKAGQEVQIGEAPTLREAKTRLKTELVETLRAGGVIKTGGKKVKIDLGFGFARSKVDPFKVVQLKSRRLSTSPETTSIQFFRKQAKRKRGFI